MKESTCERKKGKKCYAQHQRYRVITGLPYPQDLVTPAPFKTLFWLQNPRQSDFAPNAKKVYLWPVQGHAKWQGTPKLGQSRIKVVYKLFFRQCQAEAPQKERRAGRVHRVVLEKRRRIIDGRVVDWNGRGGEMTNRSNYLGAQSSPPTSAISCEWYKTKKMYNRNAARVGNGDRGREFN